MRESLGGSREAIAPHVAADGWFIGLIEKKCNIDKENNFFCINGPHKCVCFDFYAHLQDGHVQLFSDMSWIKPLIKRTVDGLIKDIHV